MQQQREGDASRDRRPSSSRGGGLDSSAADGDAARRSSERRRALNPFPLEGGARSTNSAPLREWYTDYNSCCMVLEVPRYAVRGDGFCDMDPDLPEATLFYLLLAIARRVQRPDVFVSGHRTHVAEDLLAPKCSLVVQPIIDGRMETMMVYYYEQFKLEHVVTKKRKKKKKQQQQQQQQSGEGAVEQKGEANGEANGEAGDAADGEHKDENPPEDDELVEVRIPMMSATDLVDRYGTRWTNSRQDAIAYLDAAIPVPKDYPSVVMAEDAKYVSRDSGAGRSGSSAGREDPRAVIWRPLRNLPYSGESLRSTYAAPARYVVGDMSQRKLSALYGSRIALVRLFARLAAERRAKLPHLTERLVYSVFSVEEAHIEFATRMGRPGPHIYPHPSYPFYFIGPAMLHPSKLCEFFLPHVTVQPNISSTEFESHLRAVLATRREALGRELTPAEDMTIRSRCALEFFTSTSKFVKSPTLVDLYNTLREHESRGEAATATERLRMTRMVLETFPSLYQEGVAHAGYTLDSLLKWTKTLVEMRAGTVNTGYAVADNQFFPSEAWNSDGPVAATAVASGGRSVSLMQANRISPTASSGGGGGGDNASIVDYSGIDALFRSIAEHMRLSKIVGHERTVAIMYAACCTCALIDVACFPRICITGRPETGKSTCINALAALLIGARSVITETAKVANSMDHQIGNITTVDDFALIRIGAAPKGMPANSKSNKDRSSEEEAAFKAAAVTAIMLAFTAFITDNGGRGVNVHERYNVEARIFATNDIVETLSPAVLSRLLLFHFGGSSSIIAHSIGTGKRDAMTNSKMRVSPTHQQILDATRLVQFNATTICHLVNLRVIEPPDRSIAGMYYHRVAVILGTLGVPVASQPRIAKRILDYAMSLCIVEAAIEVFGRGICAPSFDREPSVLGIIRCMPFLYVEMRHVAAAIEAHTSVLFKRDEEFVIAWVLEEFKTRGVLADPRSSSSSSTSTVGREGESSSSVAVATDPPRVRVGSAYDGSYIVIEDFFPKSAVGGYGQQQQYPHQSSGSTYRGAPSPSGRGPLAMEDEQQPGRRGNGNGNGNGNGAASDMARRTALDALRRQLARMMARPGCPFTESELYDAICRLDISTGRMTGGEDERKLQPDSRPLFVKADGGLGFSVHFACNRTELVQYAIMAALPTGYVYPFAYASLLDSSAGSGYIASRELAHSSLEVSLWRGLHRVRDSLMKREIRAGRSIVESVSGALQSADRTLADVCRRYCTIPVRSRIIELAQHASKTRLPVGQEGFSVPGFNADRSEIGRSAAVQAWMPWAIVDVAAVWVLMHADDDEGKTAAVQSPVPSDAQGGVDLFGDLVPVAESRSSSSSHQQQRTTGAPVRLAADDVARAEIAARLIGVGPSIFGNAGSAGIHPGRVQRTPSNSSSLSSLTAAFGNAGSRAGGGALVAGEAADKLTLAVRRVSWVCRLNSSALSPLELRLVSLFGLTMDEEAADEEARNLRMFAVDARNPSPDISGNRPNGARRIESVPVALASFKRLLAYHALRGTRCASDLIDALTRAGVSVAQDALREADLPMRIMSRTVSGAAPGSAFPGIFGQGNAVQQQQRSPVGASPMSPPPRPLSIDVHHNGGAVAAAAGPSQSPLSDETTMWGAEAGMVSRTTAGAFLNFNPRLQWNAANAADVGAEVAMRMAEAADDIRQLDALLSMGVSVTELVTPPEAQEETHRDGELFRLLSGVWRPDADFAGDGMKPASLCTPWLRVSSIEHLRSGVIRRDVRRVFVRNIDEIANKIYLMQRLGITSEQAEKHPAYIPNRQRLWMCLLPRSVPNRLARSMRAFVAPFGAPVQHVSVADRREVLLRSLDVVFGMMEQVRGMERYAALPDSLVSLGYVNMCIGNALSRFTGFARVIQCVAAAAVDLGVLDRARAVLSAAEKQCRRTGARGRVDGDSDGEDSDASAVRNLNGLRAADDGQQQHHQHPLTNGMTCLLQRRLYWLANWDKFAEFFVGRPSEGDERGSAAAARANRANSAELCQKIKEGVERFDIARMAFAALIDQCWWLGVYTAAGDDHHREGAGDALLPSMASDGSGHIFSAGQRDFAAPGSPDEMRKHLSDALIGLAEAIERTRIKIRDKQSGPTFMSPMVADAMEGLRSVGRPIEDAFPASGVPESISMFEEELRAAAMGIRLRDSSSGGGEEAKAAGAEQHPSAPSPSAVDYVRDIADIEPAGRHTPPPPQLREVRSSRVIESPVSSPVHQPQPVRPVHRDAAAYEDLIEHSPRAGQGLIDELDGEGAMMAADSRDGHAKKKKRHKEKKKKKKKKRSRHSGDSSKRKRRRIGSSTGVVELDAGVDGNASPDEDEGEQMDEEEAKRMRAFIGDSSGAEDDASDVTPPYAFVPSDEEEGSDNDNSEQEQQQTQPSTVSGSARPIT